ncbi:hypothetical protein ACFLQR_05440 [Verrucomicrobiota bacterium]
MFRILFLLILVWSIRSRALSEAQADGKDDPWAPLHLIRVKSKVGTLFLDPALRPSHKEIKSAVEDVLTRYEETQEHLQALLRRKQEVVDLVNETLGFVPNTEQSTTQQNVLEFFCSASLLNLAPSKQLRLYVLLKPTTKDYLRSGGKLPGFSYDPELDKASCSIVLKTSGSLRTPGDKGSRERLEWFPLLIESQDSAVRDILAENTLFEKISPMQAGMAVHELIEATIFFQIGKPTDPLFRWFSDGFANSVTFEILRRLNQDKPLEEMTKAFDPAKHSDIRQDVNLRYWPVSPYCIVSPVEAEERLSAARYSYATLEATRLIEKHGLGSVKKIMADVQTRTKQGSDDLVAAINKVIGEDMSARLRRYQKFDTTRDGLKLYGKAVKEANRNKDHEQKFINLCRFTELGLSTGFDPRAYAFIADALRDMGQIEAGGCVFKEWIKHTEGNKASKRSDIWKKLFILYAFSCDNVPMVYEVAKEYRKNHPTDGIAAIVRAHQLKTQGRVNEAKALARQLRPGIEKLNDRTSENLLRSLDWIEATEDGGQKGSGLD